MGFIVSLCLFASKIFYRKLCSGIANFKKIKPLGHSCFGNVRPHTSFIQISIPVFKKNSHSSFASLQRISPLSGSAREVPQQLYPAGFIRNWLSPSPISFQIPSRPKDSPAKPEKSKEIPRRTVSLMKELRMTNGPSRNL